MFKNIDYKVFKHSNYNLVFTLIVETLEKKKIISKDIEIELNKVISSAASLIKQMTLPRNQSRKRHFHLSDETALLRCPDWFVIWQLQQDIRGYIID